LGIGDWAQSPIPNPQSPIPNPHKNILLIDFINKYIIKLNNSFHYLQKKIVKYIIFLYNIIDFHI